MGKLVVTVVVASCSVLFLLPNLVYSEGTHAMRFVAKKDTETGHKFLYRCNENQNIVEVEQRYNPETGREDVRFIVNDQTQNWINGSSINANWGAVSTEACQASERKYIIGKLN